MDKRNSRKLSIVGNSEVEGSKLKPNTSITMPLIAGLSANAAGRKRSIFAPPPVAAAKRDSTKISPAGLSVGSKNDDFKRSMIFLSNPTSTFENAGTQQIANPMNAQLSDALMSNYARITNSFRPDSPSSAASATPLSLLSKNTHAADRPLLWTKSTSITANNDLYDSNPNSTRKISVLASARNSISVRNQSSLKTLPSDKNNLSALDLSDSLSLSSKHQNKPSGLKRDSQLISRRNSTYSSNRKSTLQPRDAKTSTVQSVLESSFSKDSHTSMLVDSFLVNIESLHQPLRGPIIQLFFLLFIIFSAILVGSRLHIFPNWEESLQVVVFISFSFFSLELGRLVYSFDLHSITPIYLTLLPFVIVIWISRESHGIIMAFWFAFSGIIVLQSGHPFLRMHLLIYYFLLLCIYIFDVYLITSTLKGLKDCTGLCGYNMKYPISLPNEIAIIINCICLLLGFLVLETYIKANAIHLLQRDEEINKFYQDNLELQKQLKGESLDNNADEIDLEAPLTKATQILAQLKNNASLNAIVKDEIDFIIGILSSDTDALFKPDIYQKPADAEVHDWLNDMMLTDKVPKDSVREISDVTEKSSARIFTNIKLHPTENSVFEFLEDRFQDPEFDVCEISDLAPGKIMYYVGWFIFRKYNFSETFGMNENKFRSWLTVVESGYHSSNAYHNSNHAADVTHSMNYYISRPRIWNMLKPEEKIAVIIAPMIHDYGHPGLNNAFLISTRDSLATRYNDQAVLENYHVSSVFEFMTKEEFDILAVFTSDQRKLIREMVISMVLSTDMAVHFDWIGKFKGKVAGNGFAFENKPDRKLLLNMAMKCADINNPSKKLKYCRKWTRMIMDEFFLQGDEEKKRGLKVSMFFDRDTTDIPKCQVGFIDFLVQPLFEAWAGFMAEDVSPHLNNIKKNKEFWKAVIENPTLLKIQDEEDAKETPPIRRALETPNHAIQISIPLIQESIYSDIEHESRLQKETLSTKSLAKNESFSNNSYVSEKDTIIIVDSPNGQHESTKDLTDDENREAKASIENNSYNIVSDFEPPHEETINKSIEVFLEVIPDIELPHEETKKETIEVSTEIISIPELPHEVIRNETIEVSKEIISDSELPHEVIRNESNEISTEIISDSELPHEVIRNETIEVSKEIISDSELPHIDRSNNETASIN